MLLTKIRKKINIGKKSNTFSPMNLFPNYPFRCRCGHEANYSLSTETSKIIHKIKCPNCNKEAIGTTGQQANDMWFGKLPDIIDIIEENKKLTKCYIFATIKVTE
jgi:hypothetical protein